MADAEWVGISIISKLEFLSFSGIGEDDVKLFAQFEERVEVVDIANADEQLMAAALRGRREKGVKLPDAIVMASGSARRAIVLTNDKRVLAAYPEQSRRVPKPPDL